MGKKKIVKKKGKKNVNSNKIIIDGIEFASKLEGFAYQELKSLKLYGKDKFLYEIKEFQIIDKFEFDGKKYQGVKITPDFVDETNKVILEIKGWAKQNEAFPMRWKLMKRYFTINNIDYKVYIAYSNQTNVKEVIKEIKEKHYKNV